MQIVEYLPSVLNTFNRERNQTNITTEREDLTTSVIPKYQSMLTSYPAQPGKFKNVVFNAVCKEIVKSSRAPKHIKPLEHFIEGLKQLERSSAFINEAVDSYFRGNDVLRDGLTYTTTTLLQYAEMLSFINRYAIRLLDNTLAYEIYYAAGSQERPPRIVVNNQKWLMKRQKDFCHAMRIAMLPEAKLKTQIENIPEKIIASSNVAVDAQAAGGMSGLDPLGFGFISGRMSPIFQAQLRLLRWQNARNEERRASIQSIEQRIVYLTSAQQGRISPKQQELIRMLEKKVRDKQRKVDEYEGEW